MIGFLLKRPVAVIMSTIAFLVLGAVAMFQLPVSLMPDVDIPEISIHYTQDNASVNEMENSITNLLRGQLQQIPSLSDITSESREGSGTITMKFEYGTSIDYAFIEVNQKVDAAMNSFPKEMQRPTIIKASTSDIPVFYIQLNLKKLESDIKFLEFCEFADAVLKKRLEHEVLGYTFACKEWAASSIHWLKERHGWSVTEEMLTFTPGIVRGLAFAIHCFTEKGDKVMVMPPVYHPFFLVAQKNEREVVFSPLVLRDGQYYIDFDRFRRDVQGCKILILSNPHNPGGRVWTKEELSQIADICQESGTLVISDEIHADLTLPPYKHPTFALTSEKARMNSLVFMSPSKAFNMPGLASSYVIIENEELLQRFRTYMEASEFCEGHLFAYLSVAAAYSHGTEWLDQVIAYIKGNVDFTENYLREHIPAVKMIRPQASYLIFLDCRGLGLNQESLNRLFVEGAHLALNDGTTFGKEGEGFMRLNVACPRATLEQALKQLERAVNNG